MYMIFAYHQYYPSGGWDDFVGEYTSIEDFEKSINHRTEDFIDVVSLETMSVVKSYERSGNWKSGYNWREV